MGRGRYHVNDKHSEDSKYAFSILAKKAGNIVVKISNARVAQARSYRNGSLLVEDASQRIYLTIRTQKTLLHSCAYLRTPPENYLLGIHV
jgi:hypothetical protein